jgi:phosphatidylglycerol---prolipoprotein diacylglyceryl transferase
VISSPIVHNPFAFNIGPLPISGFGIAVALGFLMGQYVAQTEFKRRGHDAAPVGDVLVASLIGFVVGAKAYYVALHPYREALFSRAGLVFWGGLIGGILAAWIVLRRKRIPFLRMADVGGPAIAAGYAIGRAGCWAVGDDYGRPWNGPLATTFAEGIPPTTIPVHPTQLYETAMGLVMFGILWRLRDHAHREGWLFGLYCVLAGIERFIVEFYRAKDDRFFGPLTSAQLIAIGFTIAGAVLITRLRTATAAAVQA